MGDGTGRARRAAVIVAALAVWACDDEGPETSALSQAPDAGESAAPLVSTPGDGVTADSGASGAQDAGAFGFRRDVYPVFVRYCGECHDVNGPYHDIASPDLAEAYADAVEFAERIVARIEQGNMPPACVFDAASCVPEPALATIERWIASGTPR
jgi:hypothetical protein